MIFLFGLAGLDPSDGTSTRNRMDDQRNATTNQLKHTILSQYPFIMCIESSFPFQHTIARTFPVLITSGLYPFRMRKEKGALTSWWVSQPEPPPSERLVAFFDQSFVNRPPEDGFAA